MKITHFCNSFIYLKVGETKLVCDPWVGTTTDNAWITDPINQKGKEILNKISPDYIYISHLHCDHFDRELLKKIKNKKSIFIIKKFRNSILKNRINSLGFKNVIELDSWQIYRLNKDVSVCIVPQTSSNTDNLDESINYDLDTSIIVKSNNMSKVFYNNVDNPIQLKDYKKIRQFVDKRMNSKVHVACFPVGAASEYPQCFLNINRVREKKRIENQSIIKAKKILNVLKPDFFFQAGGGYKISGKFFVLNKYIARPKFKHLFNKLSGYNCKILELEGGKELKLSDDNWSIIKYKFEKYSKKKNIDRINYRYSNLKKIDNKNLDPIFSKAYENYLRSIKKLKIKTSWEVNFYLFKNLKLNNLGNINLKKLKPINIYKIKLPKSKNHSTLKIYMDLDLFYNLLLRKNAWSGAISGSFAMFERKPNIFYPDVTFSLNYLVA